MRNSYSIQTTESMMDDGTTFGIVSNDGSEDRNETASSDYDTFDDSRGILIVDGVESSTARGRRRGGEEEENFYEPSELSMPDTFSLPTEIETLGEYQRMIHLSQEQVEAATSPWVVHKRKIVLLLFILLGAGTTGVGILFRERNSLKLSTLKLEEEIHKLEQERNEVEAKTCEAVPEWMTEQDENETNSDHLFTIVDTCWIKAKANVQIGACGDEARNNFKIMAKRARENWENFWNETFHVEGGKPLLALLEVLSQNFLQDMRSQNEGNGMSKSTNDDQKHFEENYDIFDYL